MAAGATKEEKEERASGSQPDGRISVADEHTESRCTIAPAKRRPNIRTMESPGWFAVRWAVVCRGMSASSAAIGQVASATLPRTSAWQLQYRPCPEIFFNLSTNGNSSTTNRNGPATCHEAEVLMRELLTFVFGRRLFMKPHTRVSHHLLRQASRIGKGRVQMLEHGVPP